MRLGMVLPVTGLDGRAIDAGHIARCARLIEEQGYASIWVVDSVARGFMVPDPLMALTVAATVTSGVELGTGVLQLPIRNTAELAHRILSLHLVAGGRLLLGVGPGSTKADFDALGGDYRSRMKRFASQLPELRALLETGRHGNTNLTPWPTTLGGPPIYYGAWRGLWVERAAAEAAGWIASALHNDDVILADGLHRFRDAGGRRAVVANVPVGAEIGPVLERLERLSALGFDDAVLLDLTPTATRLASLREAFRG